MSVYNDKVQKFTIRPLILNINPDSWQKALLKTGVYLKYIFLIFMKRYDSFLPESRPDLCLSFPRCPRKRVKTRPQKLPRAEFRGHGNAKTV
jgi:hypothetical protein